MTRLRQHLRLDQIRPGPWWSEAGGLGRDPVPVARQPAAMILGLGLDQHRPQDKTARQGV
jgi:hypothetical protein